VSTTPQPLAADLNAGLRRLKLAAIVLLHFFVIIEPAGVPVLQQSGDLVQLVELLEEVNVDLVWPGGLHVVWIRRGLARPVLRPLGHRLASHRRPRNPGSLLVTQRTADHHSTG
jgi:hypothetical protein